ncbi:MAG: hypothetical protein GC150_14880, partial [Rhizobiales bacterium]|nr:hypothetical protein [Hyphomicrobiales bacterium]
MVTVLEQGKRVSETATEAGRGQLLADAAGRTERHPEKAHRPETPLQRKPAWLRVKAPGSQIYQETRAIVRSEGLHTVCEEAGCPNIGECWSKR